jgi:L-rhamnonate dehydratase
VVSGSEHQGERVVEIRSIGVSGMGTPVARGTGETLVTPLAAIPGANEMHLAARGDVAHHFVELTTESGVKGYGIVGAFDGAADYILRNHLAQFVLGRSAFETNRTWELMYRGTMGYGRKGIVLSAISALDIALWDLKGKLLGRPVYDLLGGLVREEMPAYASRMYASVDIDAVVKEALTYVGQGFTALKMRFGYGPAHGVTGLRHNIRQLREVRSAVGPDVLLMVDVYMGWDSAYAIRALPELAEHDLYWLEEPLPPDDLDGYRRLRGIANQLGVLITAGEHEYTHWGCRQLLEAEAVNLLQVDVNRVGGITEAQRCWAVASAFGAGVVPHSGQLHNLHLVASHANSHMIEYFPAALGSPDRNEIYQKVWSGDPVAERGVIRIPNGPGLGIEPIWDVVERYKVLDERATVSN